MKKIISVVLVVLALTLGIVGCTDKKVTLSQEEQMYYTTYTQKIVQTLSLMTEDNFAELRSLPELEMDLTLRQGFGIPVEATEFLEIMNAWESAEQECGELNLQKNYSFTFEENSDGIVVAFEGDFEKRDATITVQFNENEFITSMDVSAHFSRGEILEKAGLNTVLGMGVVFSVLVYVLVLFSVFRFVVLNTLLLPTTDVPNGICHTLLPLASRVVCHFVSRGNKKRSSAQQSVISGAKFAKLFLILTS